MSGRTKRFLVYLLALAVLWLLLATLGAKYPALDPNILISKSRAEEARTYILSFGNAAPVVFVGLHVLQVIVAPIPGQAAAFAGGFVFGWRLGTLYTMIGLTLGSWLAITLARRFGRHLVEAINGHEAVAEFEAMFHHSPPVAAALEKTKQAVKHHQSLTFFTLMLLPGLPDDLVCFVAGLTEIPVWRLVLLAAVGRLPANLGLNLLGAGFESAESNWLFWFLMFLSILLAIGYLMRKDKIESSVKSMVRELRLYFSKWK